MGFVDVPVKRPFLSIVAQRKLTQSESNCAEKRAVQTVSLLLQLFHEVRQQPCKIPIRE
jgi:hypothetical protein